jgi:hypothetical protein
VSSRRPDRSATGNRPARRAQGPKPEDLWKAPPELPAAPPIRPASDPGAVLASLGPAPLPHPAGATDHYLAAVVKRASRLATAVAAAANLLDTDSEE